jgi:hypothetical protein
MHSVFYGKSGVTADKRRWRWRRDIPAAGGHRRGGGPARGRRRGEEGPPSRRGGPARGRRRGEEGWRGRRVGEGRRVGDGDARGGRKLARPTKDMPPKLTKSR